MPSQKGGLENPGTYRTPFTRFLLLNRINSLKHGRNETTNPLENGTIAIVNPTPGCTDANRRCWRGDRFFNRLGIAGLKERLFWPFGFYCRSRVITDSWPPVNAGMGTGPGTCIPGCQSGRITSPDCPSRDPFSGISCKNRLFSCKDLLKPPI